MIFLTSRYQLIDNFLTRIINLDIQDVEVTEISLVSRLISEDSSLFQHFCKKIRDLKKQLDTPQIFMISSIFESPFQFQNTAKEYKNRVRLFILEFLDEKHEKLVSLSLLLFQYLSKYYREYINEFIKKITSLWENDNPNIQCRAIKSLEYEPVSNQKIFLDYVDKLKEFIFNQDDCIKCYSMNLFGNIFFYLTRAGEILNLNEEETYKFIENSIKVEDDAAKLKYFEGLEHLLSEYSLFKSEWIQFFIDQYHKCSTTALRNQVLRILVYFPNKKSFSDKELNLYFNFFEGLFKELLEDKYEIEEPRVLYKPNILMDILHQFEQLCFLLPEVVDRLLSLYEKIINEYFPNLRDQKGLSSGGLVKQWTHEIYALLIKYHKDKLNSERISELTLKISNVQYSEITNIEFNINSLKHQIRILILRHDFSTVKEKFRELQGFFENYHKYQSEPHPCYPIWTFTEDLIYLLTSTHDNYNREKDRLISNLKKNNEKIPNCYHKIFEKYNDFKPMLNELSKCKSFGECFNLFKDIKTILRSTLDDIIKVDSELLQDIFRQIYRSNEYYLKDVAGRKSMEIIKRDRRVEGFSEVKDEDFDLWVQISEILNNIDLNTLYKNNLPHEDIISKNLADVLRQNNVPNVTLKKSLSGRSHIDITSGVKIAIEVKKISSNERKDDLIGQLNEDLRIGNYHFGIGYGIDTTKNQLHTRDNSTIIDFPRNRTLLIIKPNINEN